MARISIRHGLARTRCIMSAMGNADRRRRRWLGALLRAAGGELTTRRVDDWILSGRCCCGTSRLAEEHFLPTSQTEAGLINKAGCRRCQDEAPLCKAPLAVVNARVLGLGCQWRCIHRPHYRYKTLSIQGAHVVSDLIVTVFVADLVSISNTQIRDHVAL